MKRKSRGIYIDHFGIEYEDQLVMCCAYGVEENVFVDRIKRGRTVKEALTNPLMKNGKNALSMVKDHLGKTYANLAVMARAWDKPAALVRDRLYKKKWSLKRTLETPAGEHSHQVVDSMGQEYPSWNAYAKAKGLTRNVVLKLRKKGYTIEMIDNYVMRDYKKPCTDHYGNPYDSITDMCDNYNIPPDQYYQRTVKLKWPQQKALETPLRKQKVYSDEELTDSHGKRWESFRAYSRARGWPDSYALTMIKNGHTLKDLDSHEIKPMKKRA